MESKKLCNINSKCTKQNSSDVKVFGNTDDWQLICKASSKAQGWMKSTKTLEIDGVGCPDFSRYLFN